MLCYVVDSSSERVPAVFLPRAPNGLTGIGDLMGFIKQAKADSFASSAKRAAEEGVHHGSY
jgi:hypothetical protein